MSKFRRLAFAVALISAISVSAIAGPSLARAAADFKTRIEVLTRMFEYIEMYYVDEVSAEEMFDHAVSGVLEGLDPHSHYYTTEEYRQLTERYRGDYHGIGIQFEIFNGVLTVLDALAGGPSEALGLRPGDQIVGINSENAIGLDQEQIYERLRGQKGSQVGVTVRRPGLEVELEFTITRDQVQVPSISAATMLTPETGYIWLNTFSQKSADQMESHLRDFRAQGMTSLIFDLRGNRGGLMSQALRISDKFLDSGKKIVYTKGRTPNANDEQISTDRGTQPRYPVIVLVDHGSASASEIVAGALQDWDRALVVGQTTFGKGLVQNQFPFSDGSALFLTIARYYTPSGRLIQRPYEEGEPEDYMNPDWELIETIGEEEAESDEAAEDDRPEFQTSAGRTVYGGGGISPDVTVAPTRVSRFAVFLYGRRLGFQFAIDYVASHADELPSDLNGFIADFQVGDEILGEFERFLKRESIQELFERAEIPFSEELMDGARADMRMYLRADIASNLWGLEAGRIVLSQYDEQLLEALNLLPRAADLLTLRDRMVGS